MNNRFQSYPRNLIGIFVCCFVSANATWLNASDTISSHTEAIRQLRRARLELASGKQIATRLVRIENYAQNHNRQELLGWVNVIRSEAARARNETTTAIAALQAGLSQFIAAESAYEFEVRSNLIHLYLQAKQWSAAEEQIKHLLEHQPELSLEKRAELRLELVHIGAKKKGVSTDSLEETIRAAAVAVQGSKLNQSTAHFRLIQQLVGHLVNRKAYDLARTELTAAAKIFKLPHQQLIIHRTLGTIDQYQDRLPAAAQHYLAAINIINNTKDLSSNNATLEMRAALSNNLAAILQQQGKVDLAAQHFAAAKQAYQQLGNNPGVAQVTYNLGVTYDSRKEFDKALQFYRDALALYKRVGNTRGQIRALESIGVIQQRSNVHDAKLTLNQIEALERQSSDP